MTQAQLTIPGGNDKGKTLAEASDSSIKFWIGKKSEPGSDPRYAESNKRWVEAAQAELAKRGSGAAPARTAQPRTAPFAGAAMTRVPASALAGTYRDPKQITQHLADAAQHYNIVSPATSVGSLPQGCEIALSLVAIDIENETYSLTGGKNGLAKVALDRIAAAVGISWIPESCYRVDDGSHPHYVHFKVAGYYRAFDGQPQLLVAEKQMDLRDGSPACVEIEEQCRKHNAKPDRRFDRDPMNQIRQARGFILEHAESKAKNRAVRSMGVRTSYKTEELRKPFVCARIMFTGRTDDPEMARMFAGMTADSFLNGHRTLYSSGHSPQQHPPRAIAPSAHVADRAPQPPPPVGSLPADGDDGFTGEDYDHDAESEPVEPARAFTIPGGTEKGVELGKASDKALHHWASSLGSDLDSGNARDPENDAALHGALLDEIKRREGKGQQELAT